MSVARHELVGSKVVQQIIEQCTELRRFRTIGARLVVVARQQQRDGHRPDGVVRDRTDRDSQLLLQPFRLTVSRRERRQRDAALFQMFFDCERDGALETGRRQDAALVTGLGEPLHDRPQAVRHACRRIADAVVIDQEESHN